MVTKQNNEIFSTEEKYVHIKNTDVYFKRAVAVCLSVEQCEEVDEVPNIRNEEDYGNQVNDLIRRRYSLSEELAILRRKTKSPMNIGHISLFVKNARLTPNLKWNKIRKPNWFVRII